MNWIRIACKMSTSATIQRIADRCKVRRNEAQGAVVNVLCALPDHARDGDLSGVPDSQIEKWADWEGKRGAFSQAFVAEMCDDARRVTMWEEFNGKAMRRAEKDRERKRTGQPSDPDDYFLPKDEPPISALPPQEFRKLSAGIPQQEMRNGTERDGTGSSTAFAPPEVRCSTPRGSRAFSDVMPGVVGEIMSRQRRRTA